MSKSKTCVLILENLRSVENTGSIFRTAEGLGVSKIILVGTTPTPIDRFGRKRTDFAKVSLGAEELVSWEVGKSVSSGIEELKEQNFRIIALEQHPNSINLKNFQTSKLKNFALIVGNEVGGVSRATLDICDEIVEIPMQGQKESLNVSVSTGIALFVLT
ncbi:MAG: TrmH family RNA methyltransferase [Candidatus Zambryskibacteria bacterium]|nr:TrmH family RNA methyltransferase [Candidatus Zambryskibacteria bacterium]